MVEGPGCTRNGKKARALLGKRCIGVCGQESAKVAHAVRGQVLMSVLTLGKELWLLFGPCHVPTCTGSPDGEGTAAWDNGGDASPPEAGGSAAAATAVRVHFGWSGCLHVNDASPPYAINAQAFTLGLLFEEGCRLRVFKATAGAEPSAADVVAKHREGAPRDVCADEGVFDAHACVASMRSQPPSTMICDVLLDQAVLPGCGNIIKNEALHRIRVRPQTRVGLLSPETLLALVAEARRYSRAWLLSGTKPTVVYNRTACGDCGGRVSVCKLGGGGQHHLRTTFWCETCCSGGGGGGDGGPGSASASATQFAWQGGATSGAAKRGFDTGSLGGSWPGDGHDGDTATPKVARVAPPPAPPLPRAVCCSTHGSRCLRLRRTRNAASPNVGRLFFSCQDNCKHFKWADAGFPRCQCPPSNGGGGGGGGGVRPVSVLKMCKKEKNGGRWFFCCAKDQGAPGRCGFFAWAAEEQLASLGSLLSPLT